MSEALKAGQKLKVRYEEVQHYIFDVFVLESVGADEYIGEITHIVREDGAFIKFGDISKGVCDSHQFNQADVLESV